MREKTTLESLRRKLATLAGSSGMALSAYDVDRFLSQGAYYFYDSTLDGPPRVAEVERLVGLKIPRWPLTNQGTVNETFALLDARPLKGLASAPQRGCCGSVDTLVLEMSGLRKSGRNCAD